MIEIDNDSAEEISFWDMTQQPTSRKRERKHKHEDSLFVSLDDHTAGEPIVSIHFRIFNNQGSGKVLVQCLRDPSHTRKVTARYAKQVLTKYQPETPQEDVCKGCRKAAYLKELELRNQLLAAEQERLFEEARLEFESQLPREPLSELQMVQTLDVEELRSILRNDRKAYKRFALSLHPDKNSHPMAKEAFQKLVQAATSF